MKKIYFIHENTVAFDFKGFGFVDVTTDYVVTAGYVADNTSKTVWANPGGTFILEQKFEGLYFETQEEGEKALLKYLTAIHRANVGILDTIKELSHQYPEAII